MCYKKVLLNVYMQNKKNRSAFSAKKYKIKREELLALLVLVFDFLQAFKEM